MPSTEGDAPRKKSRRDGDSPRAKDKSSDKDKEGERLRTTSKKYKRRSSSPDNKPKQRTHGRSPDHVRLSRLSMTDLGHRSQHTATVSDVPEMSRRVSLGDSKMSSYPAFSKEHSREAVRPSQDSIRSRMSILTPDPTEGGSPDRPKHARRQESGSASRAPPSPPLTSDEGDLRRARSAMSDRRSSVPLQDEQRRSVDLGSRSRTSQLRTETKSGSRKVSGERASESSANTPTSSKGTARKLASGADLRREAMEKDRSNGSKTSASTTGPGQHTPSVDSQATSIAPGRGNPSNRRDETSPRRSSPSSPRGPETTDRAGGSHDRNLAHPCNSPLRPAVVLPQYTPTYSTVKTPGPPPPPPPPMDLPEQAPRVDYLLLNGGLPYLIPKSLIPSPDQPPVQPYQQHVSPLVPQANGNIHAMQVFSPITKRIDDVNKVLAKNGSVAVATGYRSVARRLLDRLEHVFARNISSEKCACVMCNSSGANLLSDEEADGVSWGEILEFVCGRRELPAWPPFTLDPEASDLGSTDRIATPMQKLDPDVPEEFRQHYMRQNDATKKSVQSWLDAQKMDASQSEAPTDVDDETLSFAMITRLETDRRPLFAALIRGQSTVPDSRNPTPANGTSSQSPNPVLDRATQALQRLYRLSSRPRKPEAALYLVTNPHLHGMLATLAAISPQEWDILVSGRFDGFLWSGADPPPQSAFPPQAPSRNATPFTPVSRGPTPFSRLPTPFSATPASTNGTSAAAPVQHDEDTEIAVLFELEQAIYRDMEAMEDAFEALHQNAQTLRDNLRKRAAGLSIAAQARRGSAASELEGRAGTPGSALGGWGGWGGGAGAEDEVGVVFDDGRSELVPEDSASNICTARRRRGKERRTPGFEDEGQVGTAADRRRRRR